VLWGLDNIKTQGEGVAQALHLLGVRPVRDALNRATEIEVVPLAELKRPRIDVVMTSVRNLSRFVRADHGLCLIKQWRRVAGARRTAGNELREAKRLGKDRVGRFGV